MKKTLAALLLALSLLTVNAAAFSDVDGGLYYAAPIAWAVEQGITTGTTEDTFSPDTLCTRGQIITFLWRSAGSPEPGSTSSPFRDVLPGTLNQDIYKAILWAGEKGIISPEDLNADSFSPAAPCDRAQAMLFLWRYSGSPAAGAPAAFTDVPPEADYAQAVNWAVERGITEGSTETTFSPGEPCTRGQIATFLYRCLHQRVSAPEQPEPAAPSHASVPAPEEARQTLTGTGNAYSLGLDGSSFTSDGVYEAEVTVDIYSPYEAVFTIKAPFPLYQACSYSARFDDPDHPGQGYVFTCLRWDEAFADMISWEGEHDQHLFSDTTGKQTEETVFLASRGEEDRMEGVISWRIVVLANNGFSFDLLEHYNLSCEVSANR